MYQFTEDCKIGIDQLDEEHRQLFQMINEATELAQGGADAATIANTLLRKLKDYADTHFAHEESYMKEIHDPELPRQQKEHAAFAEKVAQYADTDWATADGTQVLNELLSFMARWLYRHILGSDMMIGKLKKAPTATDEIVFTDEYRTGIELVDEEHARLFEIIRQTKEVISAQFLHDKYDEIVNILNELREYTILHFQDEENYMEQIGYEGLELQCAAHTAFVDRLNAIRLDDVDDNQKEYLDELLEFLLKWLTNHILKMDKQIPAQPQ